MAILAEDFSHSSHSVLFAATASGHLLVFSYGSDDALDGANPSHQIPQLSPRLTTMFGYIDINTEYPSGFQFMPAYPEYPHSIRDFSDEAANELVRYIENELKNNSALSPTLRDAYQSFLEGPQMELNLRECC